MSNALKITNKKVVTVHDWDDLVTKTYGKPYSFQQQMGCQDRGIFHISIPSNDFAGDEPNDSIPEVVNGDEMGVKFDVWLARDPKQSLKHEGKEEKEQWMIDLWWDRNFYPDVQEVANDLHKKGLIDAGDYSIEINW